jgi:uncharacterized membrane protein (UPF0127 family)
MKTIMKRDSGLIFVTSSKSCWPSTMEETAVPVVEVWVVTVIEKL